MLIFYGVMYCVSVCIVADKFIVRGTPPHHYTTARHFNIEDDVCSKGEKLSRVPTDPPGEGV